MGVIDQTIPYFGFLYRVEVIHFQPFGGAYCICLQGDWIGANCCTITEKKSVDYRERFDVRSLDGGSAFPRNFV